MKELFKQIQDAKHIEIKVKNSVDISGANALYTYILTLHKKVSLYVPKDLLERKYIFLPWFDKIKTTPTPSADICIVFEMNARELYNFFELNKIKINAKMATSLYAMFVTESAGFIKDVDGTFFAIISQLLFYGADHKKVVFYLLQSSSLSKLRLKADMLLGMKLRENATRAEFILDDAMLKKSGADEAAAKDIIKEAMQLKYVKNSYLVYNDNIIEEIEREKDFGKKK